MNYRRCLIFLVILALCLSGVCASAQDETITFGGLTVKRDATFVDLDEAGIVVTDYDALKAFINQLPNLKQLNMFNTDIKRAQIVELGEAYPGIHFGWTMNIAEHKVRTDATAFSTLHSNRSQTHTAAMFEVLKYCWNLQALDIGHNAVDDLSFLSGLTNLKILILACNQIKDISPLANLTKLEYLEIFKNRISDLSPLAGLTNLIDLNICFNSVKDWTPLYSLPELERLWIYNSNNYSASSPVPSDVVSALKTALPDTTIDYKSYSTLGGWREHPRYNVIHEIFSTGVYMPWDALDTAQ